MITARSLTNKQRRFRELRQTQSKLRSLKRQRFARRVLSRTLGPDLALVKFLDHIGDFLTCTFFHYNENGCPIRKATDNMLRAIERLKEECVSASAESRAVFSSVIRQFGTASTRLYRATRRLEVHWECDEPWRLAGLCVHVLF
jgi:hypothetical protein